MTTLRLARQKNPGSRGRPRGDLVEDLKATAELLENLRISLCTGWCPLSPEYRGVQVG